MENNNNSNNDRRNEEERKRRLKINIIISVAALFFAFFLILFLNSEIRKNTEQEITYTKFIEMLKDKKVSKVTFKSNLIYIEPKVDENMKAFAVTYYTGYVNDTNLVQNMLDKYEVEFTAEISDSSSGIWEFLLTYLLPILGIWGLLWFFMRSATKSGGLMGGVGKSTAKMYVEKKTGVTFADVAGEEEAKESLTELVDFLKNPA
ncbi:MAG: ATP-dependent metallopeptidase FtsH/Yme1/Tma family protein, partial [Eubacterium sp.]|nr:ATP-dependent metallopeptidase FtsH/Yme1/Tma family protein [Eubacterium sp.]